MAELVMQVPGSLSVSVLAAADVLSIGEWFADWLHFTFPGFSPALVFQAETELREQGVTSLPTAHGMVCFEVRDSA